MAYNNKHIFLIYQVFGQIRFWWAQRDWLGWASAFELGSSLLYVSPYSPQIVLMQAGSFHSEQQKHKKETSWHKHI